MSAGHGNGAGAKGPAKGDGKKKDDTIVKVAGVAIATGIAYSVYKSVFVGKKEEEPLGVHKFETSHVQVRVEEPEGLAKFEAGVKEKGVEFKEAVDEKGREVKEKTREVSRDVSRGVKEKGREVKEVLEEGKEKAAVQETKTKEQWGGWFNWLGGLANDKKNEAAEKAEKAKEETKKTVAAGGKSAEEKGNNFFDKADDALIKEKEDIQKGLSSAEANVEKAGSAVGNKAHKLSHGGKPHGGKPKKFFKEYGIVSGDTLWSISKKFGVSIDELKSENGIWNADFIVAGDTLTIPK